MSTYGGKLIKSKPKFKKLPKKNRQTQILETLSGNKLERNRLVDTYIKFGLPSIEEVVFSLKQEQQEQMERLYSLIDFLKANGKEYDEKNPDYQRYIKKGGDISSVILESDLNSVLVHQTHYLNYLKTNDKTSAQILASMEFIETGKSNQAVEHFITQTNTLIFSF